MKARVVIPQSIITFKISMQRCNNYRWVLAVWSGTKRHSSIREAVFNRFLTCCHLPRNLTPSAHQRGVHCHGVDQVDAWRSILPYNLHLSFPCTKEGSSLAGEKATREHSNHKKTLTISKQINKAMTKQYIYIFIDLKKRTKNVQWFQYHLYTKMFTSL